MFSKVEYPYTQPQMYDHLIFDKIARNVKWSKESLFNKWCWHNWTTTCRMDLDLGLTPCTKVRSKWIKDLNIRPQFIRYIEDKVGKTLHHIEATGIFKDDTQLTNKVETDKQMGLY